MPTGRAHDVVLFGATGFTGGLTAEYLARTAPAVLRWALAGRDPAKLVAVRERLSAIDENLATLPLLRADVSDAESLRKVAVRFTLSLLPQGKRRIRASGRPGP